MDASLLWAAVGAAGAVLSAVVAAVAARQARSAATTMLTIEKQRHHAELTPKFTIKCEAGVPQEGFALLFVNLAGGQLDAFDSVQVSILNTVDIRPWGLPEDVTIAEAEAAIWAGWQFNTFFGPANAHAASPRQSKPRQYSRASGQDWEELLLRETVPPRWHEMTRDEWRAYWRDVPLRLRVECNLHDTAEPWVVNWNVKVEHPDAGRTG